MYFERESHSLFNMIYSFPRNHSSKAFMLSLLDRILVTEEPDYSPEAELSKCNGTVLLDEAAELNAILLRELRAGNSRLYLGKDKILTSPRYLQIQNMDFDRRNLIHDRFQSIIHSGIFAHDTVNRKFKMEIGRSKAQVSLVGAIQIRSNSILSLFAIFGISISLATVILLFELITLYISSISFKAKHKVTTRQILFCQ